MHDLIGQANCVLFGFDGPLCRLFPQRRAQAATERLRPLLPAAQREPGPQATATSSMTTSLAAPATADATATADPRDLLRAADGDGAAGEIERALTDEELAAVAGAFPTAYADSLARTLCAMGRRVAVATDASRPAVERYLTTRLTLGLFAGHIHGRSGDPKLLKPHPDCLLRALESTGTAAHDAVLIGATPRDVAAARAAGIACIGYGRGERESAALREAGAGHVVDSLRTLLVAVDPGAHV